VADDDKPFPRIGRKPRPVMAAQLARRRARDELDRRVGEAAGAVTSGVRQRRVVDHQRHPATFGDKLRARRSGGSGASRWRV
jgi:hypothetical protein